jgi:hypothetical protein
LESIQILSLQNRHVILSTVQYAGPGNISNHAAFSRARRLFLSSGIRFDVQAV